MAGNDSTVIGSQTQLAKLRGVVGQCAVVLQITESIIQEIERQGPEPPAEEVVVRKDADGEVRAYFIPSIALEELTGVNGAGMHNVGSVLQRIYWDVHTFSYLLGLVGQEETVSGAVISSIAERVEGTMTELLRLSNVIGSMRPVDIPEA